MFDKYLIILLGEVRDVWRPKHNCRVRRNGDKLL